MTDVLCRTSAAVSCLAMDKVHIRPVTQLARVFLSQAFMLPGTSTNNYTYVSSYFGYGIPPGRADLMDLKKQEERTFSHCEEAFILV